MHTASVSLAVTPTVLSTLVSHYLNRKPLRHRPTAHLSYDQGLHLIRSFLTYASHHTVEELQAFTSQWVPHPQWVKVEEITVPEDQLAHAASLLQDQLGPGGIRKVGGRKWWQWRRPECPLRAEWVEMRADYNERKKKGGTGNRVMLYVHGGAYFFGSVDEHRYQMQRHARKLKGRVFAPKYRLAPQFPFPCGLQDCLAAYLYLLTFQEPNTIILAGDSAGGGMVVSILVTLRDRGIPLPAGAILISPWVDLTHSFPSVAGSCPFDYIPEGGFHHKPSEAWPPPNGEELELIKKVVIEQKKEKDKISRSTGNSDASEGVPTIEDVSKETHRLSLVIDGKDVEITEQIQVYTTNELLSHPLVSPVMQPTLGGLPPLLVIVGGGEMLRDEQIYLAHKCANPQGYLPPEELLDERARAQLEQYQPTDVQLQVWDDLCHVAPTLSFTRPAKYMYRSIAQFGAWALARAQEIEIDILDDDDISVISGSGDGKADPVQEAVTTDAKAGGQRVGRAGDPLPPFVGHMVRQRMTRYGNVLPLPPPGDLPGCSLERNLIGVVKVGPVEKWLGQKKQWDTRFKRTKDKVHKKRMKDALAGFESFGDGELPPPSALAGRRKLGVDVGEKKKTRSMGLSLWSLWGSKHDEMTVVREEQADKQPETSAATGAQGQGPYQFPDVEKQEQSGLHDKAAASRPRSRSKTVTDENQTGGLDMAQNTRGHPALPPTALGTLAESSTTDVPDTGVTGKRPRVGGIAVPFSLRKEAESASMITLNSATNASPSRSPRPRPVSPADTLPEESMQGIKLDSNYNDATNFQAGKNGNALDAVTGGSEDDQAGSNADSGKAGIRDFRDGEGGTS